MTVTESAVCVLRDYCNQLKAELRYETGLDITSIEIQVTSRDFCWVNVHAPSVPSVNCLSACAHRIDVAVAEVRGRIMKKVSEMPDLAVILGIAP